MGKPINRWLLLLIKFMESNYLFAYTAEHIQPNTKVEDFGFLIPMFIKFPSFPLMFSPILQLFFISKHTIDEGLWWSQIFLQNFQWWSVPTGDTEHPSLLVCWSSRSTVYDLQSLCGKCLISIDRFVHNETFFIFQ